MMYVHVSRKSVFDNRQTGEIIRDDEIVVRKFFNIRCPALRIDSVSNKYLERVGDVYDYDSPIARADVRIISVDKQLVWITQFA